MLGSKFKFDFRNFSIDLIMRLTIPATICCLIILAIKGLVSACIIKILSIEKDKGIYWLLNRISNYRLLNVDVLYLILVICGFLVILGLLLRIKQYYKVKMLLIKHYSLNEMNIKVDESELTEYSIKNEVLNQYSGYPFDGQELQFKINALITRQIEFINSVRKNLKKDYCLGYAGIAHTPFVFLMGYILGDENRIALFHKRRDKSTDDYFHLLSESDFVEKLSKTEIKNKQENEGTILLCIETTFNIADTEIECIKDDNDYILRYSTQNKDFDVITSMKQINQYVALIKKDIQQITQSHTISKIKICIASSVALTFALGQSFSFNHDPEIEVFHFDKKNSIKYPWGINVTSKKTVITKTNG